MFRILRLAIGLGLIVFLASESRGDAFASTAASDCPTPCVSTCASGLIAACLACGEDYYPDGCGTSFGQCPEDRRVTCKTEA